MEEQKTHQQKAMAQESGAETRAEPEQQQPEFDELLRQNREYQSAFDRKMEKALGTARSKWERERQPDEETLAQVQRLREDRDTLEQEKRQFEAKCMQVAVGTELQRRGLSAEFAPYLTGADAKESGARVDRFEELFRETLSQAVAGRMRGTEPPKEPATPRAYSREELRGMSMREINAHWAEVQKTLKNG